MLNRRSSSRAFVAQKSDEAQHVRNHEWRNIYGTEETTEPDQETSQTQTLGTSQTVRSTDRPHRQSMRPMKDWEVVGEGTLRLLYRTLPYRLGEWYCRQAVRHVPSI